MRSRLTFKVSVRSPLSRPLVAVCLALIVISAGCGSGRRLAVEHCDSGKPLRERLHVGGSDHERSDQPLAEAEAYTAGGRRGTGAVQGRVGHLRLDG